MTTELETEKAGEKSSARPTRRRRISRPGLSLLAQGEPAVWLTGGALAASLVMIVGLLALVFYAGTSTFWPVPVVEVQLHDGTTVMGEVTRSDTYKLLETNLPNIDDSNTLESAKTLLGDQLTVNVERRLVRTGNFEITNEDFQWISNFQFAAENASNPEWAIIMERVAWGRFYGTPHKFHLHNPRTIGGEEFQLNSLIELIQSNQWRFPDRTDEISAALEPLHQQLKNFRKSVIASFIDQQQQEENGQLIQLDTSAGLIKVSQYDADEHGNVISAIHTWNGEALIWKKFQEFHQQSLDNAKRRRELEKHDIGDISTQMERARLKLREVELAFDVRVLDKAYEIRQHNQTLKGIDEQKKRQLDLIKRVETYAESDSLLLSLADEIAELLNADFQTQRSEPQSERQRLRNSISTLHVDVSKSVNDFFQIHEQSDFDVARITTTINDIKEDNDRFHIVMKTSRWQGREMGEEARLKDMSLVEIVRAYPANQLSWSDKVSIYFSRWREFLFDDPREANSEGGVWPAIVGTVTMTLIMCLVVAPFGVLAALYLREYAKGGIVVSTIRVAVNNLAGVPSIVFGVFGMGFLCYICGAYIDGGPASIGVTVWTPASWYAGLMSTGSLMVAAILTHILLVRKRISRHSKFGRMAYLLPIVAWVAALTTAIFMVVKTPFFSGFYEANLPNPTFGKGGLLWSSLTLALLTLPVVIVATEEALSAVPNSLREGSYATGASKWQTIRRVVLPHAAPGIMTGVVLAMARGAGEVAPLMLVGVVKLAPELPVDGVFPFLHGDRSFMHLGFHIYDLGFQSRNSEAAKPMVYTTTLLLVGIIAFLNISAIGLRNRLRKRLSVGHF